MSFCWLCNTFVQHNLCDVVQMYRWQALSRSCYTTAAQLDSSEQGLRQIAERCWPGDTVQ